MSAPLFFCAFAALAVLAFAPALRAESDAIPEPAPLTRILGKDAAGWADHLKRYENEFERKKAMLCLAEFGEASAAAVPELRNLMKDELQIETQRFAIITLGAIGPPAAAAVPDLLAALNDANRPPAQRSAALASLAQIDPQSPAVRKAVLAAARSDDTGMRAEAIDALAAIVPYEKHALRALWRMLENSPDHESAKAAAAALMGLGEEGLDALLKGVERGAPLVRNACAETLAAMGQEAARALPVLLEAARREHGGAGREPLVLAAARIAPKDPAVLELLVEQLDEKIAAPPTPAAEESAVPSDAPKLPLEARLVMAAGEPALPAIQKGLRSRESRARLQWVEVLARLARSKPPVLGPEQLGDAAHELLARAQDRDDAVALAAIKALDAMGPVAVVAREGLAELGENTALTAPLRRAARLAALNVSREAKTPRHRSALEVKSDAELLTLLQNPAADVREDAARALLAPRPENPALAAALLRALEDPEEQVRIAAARGLVRYGKYAKEKLGTFTAWLESGDTASRKAALMALAGMGADCRPALDAIAATATSPSADGDDELRGLLAIDLRMIGPDAVPRLAEELKAKDAAVRARAALALGSMKEVGATAIPELIELAKSAVDSDAKAGFAALQAIGPAAYDVAGPYLVFTLRGDVFAERRKWATWALGEIGIPPTGDKLKVIDGLMEALLDTEPAVCRGAHAALVRIGAPALPRLRDLMRIGEGETPYWAVRVMARLKADPADVIPRLDELTQPGKLPVERGVAAELLGEYAPEHREAMPILLRVLSDREDFVARAAMRSLALYGEDAIPAVKKLLKHRNPLVRRRVFRALEYIRDRLESRE